jgi:hypothetical protein
MSENAQEGTPQTITITVSGVLALLDQGMSRKEIAEHYGKTQVEMKKMVWGHPKLKNLKAKKQYTSIELLDDTEDINDTHVEEESFTGEATNELLAETPTMEVAPEEVPAPNELEQEFTQDAPEATQAFIGTPESAETENWD